MASVSASDIPIEQQFMGDLWSFRKAYYTWEDSPDYWEAIVKASNDLSDKYRNDFFDMMLMACIDDIERRGNIAINAEYRSREPLVKKFYERIMRRNGKTA